MFVFAFVINTKSKEQRLAFSTPCLLFPKRDEHIPKVIC